jgi:hydrogenase maturation factor HypF (carbamoyltransferase family)
MADVDETMLAYSFYESLVDFMEENISKISEEIKSKDLILCGNMFSNSILLSKLDKKLNNINILIPKEYPIDL